jgi:transcriptional regulator MraZ
VQFTFRGTFEQRVDDKGRVAIPQRWREILSVSGSERLLITNSRAGSVPCLDAYPAKAWERLEEKLLSDSQTLTADERMFYLNFYIPEVQECVLDRQGRILLPGRLRSYAKLDKDVLFTGVLNMFKIWDPAAQRPVHEAGEQVLINNPQIVPGFGF